MTRDNPWHEGEKEGVNFAVYRYKWLDHEPITMANVDVNGMHLAFVYGLGWERLTMVKKRLPVRCYSHTCKEKIVMRGLLITVCIRKF